MILLLGGFITGLLIIYITGKLFERHVISATMMLYTGFVLFTGGIANFITKDMGLEFSKLVLIGFILIISAIATFYVADSYMVGVKRKNKVVYYEVED